jgi:serine/threonine-protein kinase
MEYVPGMSLRDLIARQGLPTPGHAIHLGKQALSALDYAHNFSYLDENGGRYRRIIHRDIKPANLLIGARGTLKITDFGIVKVVGDEGLTQSGFQPGTVEYMSPEQYEMLTGRLPFPRSATGSDWNVRKGHIEMAPPEPTEICPDLSPVLSAIVMRSLQKEPKDRYGSAAEFLDALRAIDSRETGAAAGGSDNDPAFTNGEGQGIQSDRRCAGYRSDRA